VRREGNREYKVVEERRVWEMEMEIGRKIERRGL
jgi:hypothetical protein